MSFYYYGNNAPDCQIILNRGDSVFERDITDSVISFNTSNDIGGIGTFSVTLDNTNDRHVDRYNYVDIKKMSSIEIFVQDNEAWFNNYPKGKNIDYKVTSENTTVSSIVREVYGEIDLKVQNQYMSEIMSINPDLPSVTSLDSRLPTGLKKINLPPFITQYNRVLLGVVLTVSQNFSAGTSMTVQLNGESIGWWLKATTVNLQPSLTDPGLSNSTDSTAYANKYSDQPAYDIIKDLLKFTSNNMISVQNFSFDVAGQQSEYLTSIGENIPIKDSAGNIVINDSNGQVATLSKTNNIFINKTTDTITAQKSTQANSTLPQKLTESDNAKDSIYQGNVVAGDSILPTASSLMNFYKGKDQVKYSQARDWNNYSTQYKNTTKQKSDNLKSITSLQSQIVPLTSYNSASTNSKLYSRIEVLTKTNNDLNKNLTNIRGSIENNPLAAAQLESINNYNNDLKDSIVSAHARGVTAVLEQFNIIQHWKKLFTSMILEVADDAYLRQVHPIKMVLKSPDMMDGNYSPKYNVIKGISDAIFFEFYMDTNGHFVLKPPFYNIGVPDNNPTYVIEEEDIISMSLNDTVDGIITRIGVLGDITLPVNLNRQQIYALHQDFNLINNYGIHHQDLRGVIIAKNITDCRQFGQAYMAKNNSELFNGSITILGRPTLRLGVALYLKPRDTVYYIKGITHDFQVGGNFTTTISLTAGRRVVTGYLVESKIITTTPSNVNGFKINAVNEDKNQSGIQVKHYVVSSSSDYDQDRQQYQNQLNKENGVPSTMQTGEFQIITNSYIITDHPNIGFIGLIVDNDSEIVSSINQNIYNYLISIIYFDNPKNVNTDVVDLSTTAFKNTVDYMKTTYGKNIQPFKILQEQWKSFATDNNVTSAKGFTKDLLDKFLQQTSLNIQKQLQEIEKSLQQKQVGDTTSTTTTKIDSAVNASLAMQILDEVVNDINVVGTYQNFTDKDGREYPTTLNYAKQLTTSVYDANVLTTDKITNAREKVDPSIVTDKYVSDVIKLAEADAKISNKR